MPPNGSASRAACSRNAFAQLWSNGVPASRVRRRCALNRDMPAARAAAATQPVSASAVRKMRCLAGVQYARGEVAGAVGAGDGVWVVCSIRELRA